MTSPLSTVSWLFSGVEGFWELDPRGNSEHTRTIVNADEVMRASFLLTMVAKYTLLDNGTCLFSPLPQGFGMAHPLLHGAFAQLPGISVMRQRGSQGPVHGTDTIAYKTIELSFEFGPKRAERLRYLLARRLYRNP
jgi:hypothetical protein